MVQRSPADNPVHSTPETMRAAVIVAPNQMHIQEQAIPALKPDEVLVRLSGCGVCASNLPVWEGREWFTYPLETGQPGHEGWGYVVETGDAVENIAVGDYVAMLSYRAYAEYDVAPSNCVVRLPVNLEGKPFPGEPLGCAVNIIQRSDIQAGQTVAIIGIGFLGALLTQLCVNAGARVIAIARRQYALDIARDFGAAETLLMDDYWRVIEEVKRLTNGHGCERVTEAVGEQLPLDLAAELTCERGKLIIAGYHQDGPRQVNMQQWNWRGLDVINAHERDPQIYIEGIRRAVRLVSDGLLDPTPLFTHTFPLEDLAAALNIARERPESFMKALVQL